MNASGAATVWVHIVRDAAGNISSGAVDFNVNFNFPGPVTVVAMHIHPGAAGVAGPPAISSGLSAANPVASNDGKGSIRLQGQVPPSDTNNLALLKDLLANPGNYYVNLHTIDNPGGAIRGQLERAEMVVLMGLMSPQNEVPAAPENASAVSSVIALKAPSSGQVIFDVNYAFPAQATLTGLHIHPGPAGVNGPVAISSGLAGQTPTDSSGSGNLHFEAEVNMSDPTAVRTLNGLFLDPSQYYINIHTTDRPAGFMRAQLRFTDPVTFQMNMLSSNETPAITGLNASAPAAVTVYTLRNPDGSVPAGVVIFDVNPRFPAAARFTGLHVHEGSATQAGPVRISSGLSATNAVSSDASGFANAYRVVTVNAPDGLAALNGLVKNPENYYLNIHTTDFPGGAARAQLLSGTAVTAAPLVGFAMSAISDPARTTVAPGGLMTVFGNNLTKVPATLLGFAGNVVPTTMNGSTVALGGRPAPLLVLTPTYAVVQVPVETAAGPQPLVMTTGNGASAPLQVTVAAVAPAIYFDQTGGIVQKNADYSLVRPGNPARAGDLLLIWSTGLGQTTPPLETGRIVAFPPPSNTASVTVTVGGQNAEVVYSIASPGFVGLYQTLVRMPAGVTPGAVPLVMRVGNVASNTVTIAAQ